jgi:hypothetical protein
VKRTGWGESVGAVIHICMETTQENSQCSYLYLKLAKTSCFSFYLFSSTKLEDRRAEQVLPKVRVVGTGGRGEVFEKGVGG